MEHSKIQIWLKILKILCGVSVFIVLANIIEIVLLLNARKRWRNAQVLIVHLALTDMALGLITIISASVFLSNLIRFSTAVVILGFVFYGNMCGSSFIVVLISVDRWVAVKWPLKYRALMTKSRLNFAILGAWVLSIFILSLMMALGEYYTGGFSIGGVILIIETLLLVYLYFSIFILYRKSAKTISNDDKNTNNLERNEVPNKKIHREEKNYLQNEGFDTSFSKASSAT